MLRELLEKVFPCGCKPADGKRERLAGTRIALVGNPNVGKSVLFGNLTGTYVTVSNYPGTTVEVTRGVAHVAGKRFEVIDTPGMYSLLPLSEEERVARAILLDENPEVVLHVVDAKNLERMLLLTVQLIEAGFPVALVLNMMDEAREAGLVIDESALARELGIPVVATVSTRRQGMDRLEEVIAGGVAASVRRFEYGAPGHAPIEEFLERIERLLPGEVAGPRRALALLLLQEDAEAMDRVRADVPGTLESIRSVVNEARARLGKPVDYLLTLQRRNWTEELCRHAVRNVPVAPPTFTDRLNRLLVRPITGIPILLLVLYLGLYKFVGQFGAGVVVDFIQTEIFERFINPWLVRVFDVIVPWQVLRDLFVGEYGVLTLGLRYAVAIILPIVFFFFLVFSIIEDTGYLPRLALLLDRLFKRVGLSGRAVIPMVLGFGCVTMATLVTRTLSTRRERLIAMILLSVAVPCSAQLGVIIALLSHSPAAFILWAVVMLGVYLAVGTLAARFIPGRRAPFYVEIPPLRLPSLRNILAKTFARVKWYLVEIVPVFLLASVLIWLGQLTGLFDLVRRGLEVPVGWIGLPAETSKAFLFGFFRRDYGAAGLYDLYHAGTLSNVQLLVACVALTLFLPCVAQFLVTVRERSWKSGLAIAAMVLLIAFGVAFVLRHALDLFNVTL